MAPVVVIVVVVVVFAGGALWVSSRRRADDTSDRQLLEAELSVLADDVVNLEAAVAAHPEARADYDAAVSRYRAAEAAMAHADEDATRAKLTQMVAEATYSMSRARAITEGREPPAPPPVPRARGRAAAFGAVPVARPGAATPAWARSPDAPSLAPRPLVAPLAGLRVVDCSTVVAGPACARYLADFGATVIKVERPDGGDTTRTMGMIDPRDGESLFWKYLGRGKHCVAIDLKDPSGRARFEDLVAAAHVVVENFRPGTLERLGLGPDVLLARNPRLVITRVTGFGQDGPYASRAGFATLAEAMSGFAGLNGEPDGAPLLPPIALTDEVTALAAAFATLAAVQGGVGQVVDVNLLESLLQVMGPLPSAYASTGYLQPRLGSGIPYSVPRGTWQCSDGRWVAISTSAESVARRVMDLIGLGHDERLQSFAGRVAHRALVDAHLADWIRERTLDDVLRAFEGVEAAAAPVYDMADIAADPHLRSRQSLVELDGTTMQGLVARLSATPGALRWAGRRLGADDDLLDADDPWRAAEEHMTSD